MNGETHIGAESKISFPTGGTGADSLASGAGLNGMDAQGESAVFASGGMVFSLGDGTTIATQNLAGFNIKDLG